MTELDRLLKLQEWRYDDEQVELTKDEEKEYESLKSKIEKLMEDGKKWRN